MLDASVATMALADCTFFLVAYHLAAPYFSTERKRAYILSTICSGTMSIISLPFVWDYLVHGLGIMYSAGQVGWKRDLGKFGVVFFGSYLFCDLAIGWWRYRSQVGLLTGWIHHTCYIGLMVHLLNTTQSPIFLVGAIMEAPTFDLAISNLFPRVRNDLRFLISFFLIRIAFHFCFLLDCLRPSSQIITQASLVPAVTLSLALILHVSWFHSAVIGYRKRNAAAKGIEQSQPITATTSPGMEASGVPDMDEEMPTPELLTPEDSPLVTPHTPSSITKDSTFFPQLPQLPSMPNIPHLQLPQLQLSRGNLPTMPTMPTFDELRSSFAANKEKHMRGMNMNFGFKNAVKSRWESGRSAWNGSMDSVLGAGRGQSGLAAEESERKDEIVVL